MEGRFSIHNIRYSIPEYLKVFFISKHSLYMPFLLLAIFYYIRKHIPGISAIALTTTFFFFFFPFFFSSDLEMVGTGASYVALCGTFLFAPIVDYIKARVTDKRVKIFSTLFVTYCLINIGVNYYYNYLIKYEKSNTTLQKNFTNLIPDNATVYGPIRQWPMAMKYNYYSDHYRYQLPKEFDYIILNEQDKDLYSNNKVVLKKIHEYGLIYQKESKQYGTVSVYAKKSKISEDCKEKATYKSNSNP